MQITLNQEKKNNVSDEMIQLMQKQASICNMKSIMNIFKKHFGEDCMILNVYMYGSRLYGTANETSDFDLYVIADDTIEEVEVSSVPPPMPNTFYIRVDDGELHCDITVLKKTQFLNKLKQCFIHEMICLWAPDCFVLKSDVDLWKELESINYCFSMETLQNTILFQTNFVWNACMKAFNDSMLIEDTDTRNEELYKAKKGIVHTLRFFMYGIQIATTGNISDYSVCDNHIRHEWIKDSQMTDWQLFASHFQPLYDKLKIDFIKSTSPFA
jgi:predicted nucleotidyltransferase